MIDNNNNESDLLEAIRQKDTAAWGKLIDEYQGRLLNYAKSKVKQPSDAEDAVQETFVSLLKILQKPQTRIQRLESYLFMILKNTICTQYRSRWARSVSLIQDAYQGKDPKEQVDAIAQVASDDLSVSRYVSINEEDRLRREKLEDALEEIASKYKDSRNFRDLKICDLLFYSRMSSHDTAHVLDQNDSSVRVFKHRFIKRVNQQIPEENCLTDDSKLRENDTFFEIWEASRLTCPKYSTLVNFTMEKLDPDWFDYIDFHLTTIGCHFCRASFKDIQHKYSPEQQKNLHESIMASTIGFFNS